MSFATEIVCPRCIKHFPLAQLFNLCACGSPLMVRYDLKKAAAMLAPSSFQQRGATLWRYRELLPVQDEAHVVSLGEGFTPLLEAKTLAREIGLRRALGASNRSVVGLFLRHSARQLAVGLSLSAVLSIVVLAVISQGFSISAGEAALIGATVVSVISATVLLSVYVSLRSAIRLDPSSALRQG